MSDKKIGAFEKGYNKWNGVLNRAFYGKKPKERFLLLFMLVIHFFAAVFFSKTVLPYTDVSVGVPLVDALLCSAGSCAFGVYAGAVYGAIITKTLSFSRIFVLTAVFILRIAVSFWSRGPKKDRGLLCESVLVKVGYASFTALVQCAFHLTVSGIYEGVWVKLLATVIALPVLSAVFSFFFAGCPRKSMGNNKYLERALYEISMTLFFAAAVYSLKETRYFGISLASLTALILTLVCSSKGGMIRGAAVGVTLGLVYNPALALSVAAVGGVSGVFYALGVLPAAGISAFIGALVALWQVGYTALIGFIPETVMAVAIISPMIRYSFIPERFPYPKNEMPKEYATLGATEARVIQNVRKNGDVIRLSEALMDISKSLSVKSVEEGGKKTKEICENLCSSFCDSCALNSICWETEASRAESSVKGIVEAIRKGEALPHDRRTNYLSGYCIKFKELSDEIRRLCDGCVPRVEKTPLYEATAFDLKKVSEMLSDIANRSRLEEKRDADAESAVISVAGEIGFKPETISVSGTERKRIYACGVKNELTEAERERIRKAFSEACKTEYSAPVFSEELSGCMVFEPEKTLMAKTFCLKATKEGELCSGDSTLTALLDDGCFYAILADGMGSGEEAKRASGAALSMLERLLRCRVNKTTATELVGDILRRRREECFTTVDIMELDLVSGNASFLKSGAAASYVVRNGGVYCINACSMPVGITDKARPEEMSFRLQKGDIVIMLSDGVATDTVDGKWIADTVCGGFSSNEELAGAIMKKAGELHAQKDDKTVMVISIDPYSTAERAKEA